MVPFFSSLCPSLARRDVFNQRIYKLLLMIRSKCRSQVVVREPRSNSKHNYLALAVVVGGGKGSQLWVGGEL